MLKNSMKKQKKLLNKNNQYQHPKQNGKRTPLTMNFAMKSGFFFLSIIFHPIFLTSIFQGVHHPGATLPWINEENDEGIVAVAQNKSYKCPITQDFFKNPYKSFAKSLFFHKKNPLKSFNHKQLCLRACSR